MPDHEDEYSGYDLVEARLLRDLDEGLIDSDEYHAEMQALRDRRESCVHPAGDHPAGCRPAETDSDRVPSTDELVRMWRGTLDGIRHNPPGDTE